MASSNQSARTYIGVGPRHTFMFAGTGGSGVTQMAVDNLLGGITAEYTGVGTYHIEHGLGNTAYSAVFSAEHSSFANVYMVTRGTSGFTLEVEDAAGSNLNPSFVHGAIHDGGG